MKDWDALYEECIHCQKCGLAETRTNVVFGEGARDAEVMFIGEGPGCVPVPYSQAFPSHADTPYHDHDSHAPYPTQH